MPVTMLAFAIAGLAMVGVPGTVGFVSKWYLALGAGERGDWWLVGLLMAGSLITLAYMWRVMEVAFFRAPSPRIAQVREAPPEMLVPALVLVGACIWFGLDTQLSADVAARAAALLLGSPA